MAEEKVTRSKGVDTGLAIGGMAEVNAIIAVSLGIWLGMASAESAVRMIVIVITAEGMGIWRGRRGGGNSGACFACGEPGHMSRDCMGGGSNRGGGGFGRFGGRGSASSGGKCFNYGESGHFARECTEPLSR